MGQFPKGVHEFPEDTDEFPTGMHEFPEDMGDFLKGWVSDRVGEFPGDSPSHVRSPNLNLVLKAAIVQLHKFYFVFLLYFADCCLLAIFSLCAHTFSKRAFSFFFKFLVDKCPFCGATVTPILDFWWHLLWVSEPELATLFGLGRGIHEIK